MQPADHLLQRIHSRRPPAHLSVSLKHMNPSPTSNSRTLLHHSRDNHVDHPSLSTTAVASSANANQWFTASNEDPARGVVIHDEPPYLLKRSTSSKSEVPSRLLEENFANMASFSHPTTGYHDTNESTIDDYRSVIDDLTVKNKKLKSRLKKFEMSHATHMDDEKLFEVKMHGLPPHKRRELEEMLRQFASSASTSLVGSTEAAQSRKGKTASMPSRMQPHPRSSTSNSASAPHDSAYASNSISEPASGSAKLQVHQGTKNTHTMANERWIANSEDFPGALLPKYYPLMTEKTKRKAVVRRLEQLFTGKGSPVQSIYNQSLQQEEISRSAARADKKADEFHGRETATEGLRQAHMLAGDVDIDRRMGGMLQHEHSTGSSSNDAVDSNPDEQRPTRPLDLDPERAQIPADNLDYIKHLSIDPLHYTTQESNEAADADGWVYLNLLVSMAQLHMINVTPDFIRSAVAEVSEKFELSQDGRKLRWRGGTEGTRLSSDSGTESGGRMSSSESENLDELLAPWQQETTSSEGETNKLQTRFRAVPATSHGRTKSHPFHYKPMFKHGLTRSEEEYSTDVSEAHAPILKRDLDGQTMHSTKNSQTVAVARNMTDEGLVIFYNGSSFCIDLSADRTDIATPLHTVMVDKDGFSKHTHDALGCPPLKRPSDTLRRTESGSPLSYRPFKDYSILGEHLITPQFKRARTPEKLESGSDSEDEDLKFLPNWSDLPLSDRKSPIEMNACGLGGTQPADHFLVSVNTSRTRLGNKDRARLSRFSAPNAKRRKFLHSISRTSLDSFRDPERSAESIIQRLEQSRVNLTVKKHQEKIDLPVKTVMLSTQFRALAPSELPPPANYYDPFSSIDNESDKSEDYEEIKRLRARATAPYQMNRSSEENTSSEQDTRTDTHLFELNNRVRALAAEDSGDDEESIDMLAEARALNPEAIAAQEAEFDLGTRDDMSLAADGGVSSQSSTSSQSSEDMDAWDSEGY